MIGSAHCLECDSYISDDLQRGHKLTCSSYTAVTEPKPTAADELREQLAAIEHERWSDWQRYVFSVCHKDEVGLAPGEFVKNVIPSWATKHWWIQIETPYAKLSKREQASDMEQVDRYWFLVQQYVNQQMLTVLQELQARATHIVITKDMNITLSYPVVTMDSIDEVMKRYQV